MPHVVASVNFSIRNGMNPEEAQEMLERWFLCHGWQLPEGVTDLGVNETQIMHFIGDPQMNGWGYTESEIHFRVEATETAGEWLITILKNDCGKCHEEEFGKVENCPTEAEAWNAAHALIDQRNQVDEFS